MTVFEPYYIPTYCFAGNIKLLHMLDHLYDDFGDPVDTQIWTNYQYLRLSNMMARCETREE